MRSEKDGIRSEQDGIRERGQDFHDGIKVLMNPFRRRAFCSNILRTEEKSSKVDLLAGDRSLSGSRFRIHV